MKELVFVNGHRGCYVHDGMGEFLAMACICVIMQNIGLRKDWNGVEGHISALSAYTGPQQTKPNEMNVL